MWLWTNCGNAFISSPGLLHPIYKTVLLTLLTIHFFKSTFGAHNAIAMHINSKKNKSFQSHTWSKLPLNVTWNVPLVNFTEVPSFTTAPGRCRQTLTIWSKKVGHFTKDQKKLIAILFPSPFLTSPNLLRISTQCFVMHQQRFGKNHDNMHAPRGVLTYP